MNVFLGLVVALDYASYDFVIAEGIQESASDEDTDDDRHRALKSFTEVHDLVPC